VLSTATGELSRSQWRLSLRSGFKAARLLRLRVRISPNAWMFVSFECWVLSGRGFCFGLTTRPEEANRDYVFECDREDSIIMRALPNGGRRAMNKKKWGDLIPSIHLAIFLNIYLMVIDCTVVKECPKSNIIIYTKTWIRYNTHTLLILFKYLRIAIILLSVSDYRMDTQCR
jgi:hypothetical protein